MFWDFEDIEELIPQIFYAGHPHDVAYIKGDPEYGLRRFKISPDLEFDWGQDEGKSFIDYLAEILDDSE
ncbi:hypothetical protein AN618_18670 [Fervidicola ferrireducens]|uniref:Uncharacterized protein n=1 Tax=Fervidicola ferrireducens TaxID=520764 RepID=A0A140L4M4_9FIRM|nr:hypothetical protein [Fervidicola ferrireducens]KXG75499.1 hypothetical protein AN618_18670 [Fervidicola ferrireducens]